MPKINAHTSNEIVLKLIASLNDANDIRKTVFKKKQFLMFFHNNVT